jgi:hypothetical protein
MRLRLADRWPLQLRFSASFWFFLIGVTLLFVRRYLPGPLHSIASIYLLPYAAFASLLMRLTNSDLHLGLGDTDLSPFLSVVTVGPLVAMYMIPSLVVVAFAEGKVFSWLLQVLRRRFDQSPAEIKPMTNTDRMASSSGVHLSCAEAVSTTSAIAKIFATIAVVVVLTTTMLLNLRGEPGSRTVGSVSFSPITVPAWNHGWPLTWLNQEMSLNEASRFQEQRRTNSSISARWTLKGGVEQTTNRRARWYFRALLMDAISVAILTIVVGTTVLRFTDFLWHITSARTEL